MAHATVEFCDNMNHRRTDSPVKHCPKCGAVTNARLARTHCDEQRHSDARRRQSTYCVDCGQQLIAAR